MSIEELSGEERSRYARHLMLPEVGQAGQERLKASSVLCVGAGGLGSPLLLYLAAAGVGRIGIVDGDVVELSNLQRQVIHGMDWLGQSKGRSAAHRLQELNPHCQVVLHQQMLDRDNWARQESSGSVGSGRSISVGINQDDPFLAMTPTCCDVNAATRFGDTTFLTKNSDEHQTATTDLFAGSRSFPGKAMLGWSCLPPTGVQRVR